MNQSVAGDAGAVRSGDGVTILADDNMRLASQENQTSLRLACVRSTRENADAIALITGDLIVRPRSRRSRQKFEPRIAADPSRPLSALRFRPCSPDGAPCTEQETLGTERSGYRGAMRMAPSRRTDSPLK
jgi:hypothetical protein